MDHQTYKQIQISMREYTAKGTKSGYKKKQMKRLFAIIEEIFQHEKDNRLDAIGRRQLSGFWARTENEADQTRLAKYQILKKFFRFYNPKVTVPKPRLRSN